MLLLQTCGATVKIWFTRNHITKQHHRLISWKWTCTCNSVWFPVHVLSRSVSKNLNSKSYSSFVYKMTIFLFQIISSRHSMKWYGWEGKEGRAWGWVKDHCSCFCLSNSGIQLYLRLICLGKGQAQAAMFDFMGLFYQRKNFNSKSEKDNLAPRNSQALNISFSFNSKESI
jgi:hypothetical protein